MSDDKSNETFWGSDVIASALRETGIPYACLNPGASYRGLHDSLVNFLGNENPKMLLNLHEEHAIAIAQGYAKACNEPLIAIVHSNVGLMHATMGIFNAWCDRVPMVVIGATGPLDAATRRPHIDWIHTSIDQAALIRDYVKWDDQPGSPAAAVDAIRKGRQIACTPPYGPVYICLDAAVQEMQLDEWPEFNDIGRYQSPPPPSAPAGAVEAAAEMLLGADNPLILAGKMPRSDDAWDKRVRLAEAIGAKAVNNSWQEIGFPTNHPLHVKNIAGFFVGGPVREAHEAADVVLSLDWFDLGGTMNHAWNGGEVKPKVINCSMDHHLHGGWSKDHGQLAPVDLHVPTTPEAFIDELLPLVEKTGKGQKNNVGYQMIEPQPVAEQEQGVIGIRDLAQAVRAVMQDDDISLISHTIGWPADEAYYTHPLACLGNAGGGGLGAGTGNAIGSALAMRDKGSKYLPLAILGDGDYLMGVSALWAAAHERIPVLILVANNNSYFNDEMHQEAVAKKRGRPVENRWIGQRIDDPEVDICAIAEAQGMTAEGPVDDRQDLIPALKSSIEKVRAGASLVMEVKVTPEYATSPVHERKS
ncbi:MAG: thiamine pyrophosphate-binding protein [Rhodospirillaceae bacterium]|nr:thiamine pyrophosphate-binding protein [Rhodospirillaceae bacterium]